MKRALSAAVKGVPPSLSLSSSAAAEQQPTAAFNSKCWVELSAVSEYVLCTILNYNSHNSSVCLRDDTSGDILTVPTSQTFAADEVFGLQDNAELKALNYPNVLENIHYRFRQAAAPHNLNPKPHCIYVSSTELN